MSAAPQVVVREALSEAVADLREAQRRPNLHAEIPVREARVKALQEILAQLTPPVADKPPITTAAFQLPRPARVAVPVAAPARLDGKRLRFDFGYFTAHALDIPYRAGCGLCDDDGNELQHGPMVLNSAQRKVMAVAIDQLLVKQQVLHLIILKARQLGCTTLFLAFYFWLAVVFGHFRLLLIIDKGKHVDDKRRLLMDWMEHLPAKIGDVWQGDLPREISRKDGTILWSNGSMFMFETANAVNAGTSLTITGLHESEMTKWRRGTVPIIRSSVTPSLPKKGMGIHVNESTALGIDPFYREWMDSKNGGHVIPLFLPWYLSTEYCLPVPIDFDYDDQNRALGDDGDDSVWIPESAYAARYKLSDGQIMWRRDMILSPQRFKGNRARFDEEYPTTEAHAFRTVARNFMPVNMLLASVAVPPVARGRLVDLVNNPSRQGLLYSLVKPGFVSDEGGLLRVWEFPVPGAQYFLGGDVATGRVSVNDDGDSELDATDFRITREDGVCVAKYVSRERPEEVWYPLLLLAVWYNTAWVNVEKNNPGATLLVFWLETFYPNNYVEDGSRDIRDRIWCELNAGNRTGVLNDLRAAWCAAPTRLLEEDTIEEATNLIVNGRTGKVEAAPGCHDDAILAAAHGEQMRVQVLGREEASLRLPGTVVVNDIHNPTMTPVVPRDVYDNAQYFADTIAALEAGATKEPQYGW